MRRHIQDGLSQGKDFSSLSGFQAGKVRVSIDTDNPALDSQYKTLVTVGPGSKAGEV